MDSTSSAPRIAIVGAGASGSLLAIQLLRQARAPLQVFLIERSGHFGRGVAYSTRCPDHLLNVPAGRMGAFPDDPGDFLRWIQTHAGRPGFPASVGADDFVSRSLYGGYIQDLLAQAQATRPPAVQLITLTGEAVDVEETADHLIIRFADDSSLHVDQVVLAIGNLPGEYPIPRPLPVYRNPRYVHIPWREDVLDGLGEKDEVLLVGQGLTATDLIVQLERRGHQGTIHALSRHGIRPQIHHPNLPSHALSELGSVPPTIRAWTRKVRSEIAAGARAGVDWRAVLDALRPHTQEIWQRFAWEERARFMRHVRPFWDAHRHRVPAETARVLDRLADEGRLKFYAGRLQVLEGDAHGLQALVRVRRSIKHISLNVAKVINCTGARTDYTKYQHPLLVHLLARGLIGHDELALGINALPTGEIIRYRGEPLGRIFTIGAPLKGVLWESTAVREIRAQAQALAERLLAPSPSTTHAG